MGYNVFMIEDLVELESYQDHKGSRLFTAWLNSLKDLKAKGVIRARLNRVRMGNFGDCKSVSNGVFELRINLGPGYRIYFGKESETKMILLTGGDKSTQKRNIEKANQYWSDYRR